MPSLEEREFLRDFESCTLANDCFHHADHVRVAWLYLNMFPFWEAAARFRQALLAFATAHGKATRFHETITFAYLALVNERLRRAGSSTWEEFTADNTDLLAWNPSILSVYYTEEALRSELARQIFVMPDRIQRK